MKKVETERLLRMYVMASSVAIVILVIGLAYTVVRLNQLNTHLTEVDCDAIDKTGQVQVQAGQPQYSKIGKFVCNDSWVQ
jgi:cytochrome c oxidase assembly protein Cox11